MKTRHLLSILFFIGFLPGFGQYLLNPSFEGTILMIGPPPDWDVCMENSTPNVQPGKYAVYLPPSDGLTYIGLLTRDNYTWEDSQTALETPLSQDSCYFFQIDLAFQEFLSFTSVDPIVLNVYGSTEACEMENLLWTSPPISNTDWVTYDFLIHNDEFDITDLVLECYYAGSTIYYGYMLLDNIRITPTPFAELGNDTTLTICSNDSIILDPGSGFAGYLWQDGSDEQTFVVDTTGLYWVQVFNSEGCSWTDSIYITLEEYLMMESQTIDSTLVCEGQEVVLTASVLYGVEPYSYQWLNLPDTTQSITVATDTSMYFYFVVTDNCGSTLLDSIKIVVVQNPDIDLGNDTLICADGNFVLEVELGYYTYLWQDGTSTSNYVVTEPGIYWVEVTSFFGCSARDSITIDVFPPILLDLGEDTTLCVGETVTFTVQGEFVEYLWQDNSTDTAFTASVTGEYWVMVTDIYGCHATDSIYATFLPAPVVDIGNDTAFCEGESLILDAGSGFQSYLWQNNDTTQYFNATAQGYYWVTVSNGCGEDTDSVYVNLYPAPQPNLGPDSTICVGESVLLSPGGQYISYLWQDNSTLSLYSASVTGYYSVTVSNEEGCFGEDEVFIEISDPQVDLGTDKQLCEGETVILDAGVGFTTYLWQDNSTAQTYPVNVSGTYSVSVENEHECETSDEVTIAFYPSPNPIIVEDQSICEGETAVLEAPDGDFNYYWNGTEGNQSIEVSSSGQYILTMANPCDSISHIIQIFVDPLPAVYLGEDETIVQGESIELNAGSGFDEYLWQDGSTGQFYIVNENNIDPANPYYYVEVTEGSCKNSDTVMIELFQVWVPNLITPNGDGDNDYFRADPEKWGAIGQHNMMVFNRWGEKIWESPDFITGWDGKQNGRFVADGTYFWILDVYYGQDNKKQTLKGSLTVLGTN